MYINTKLISLRFSLRRDILNYYDINLITFFNHCVMCFILNIYSDDHQKTLKYLKDTDNFQELNLVLNLMFLRIGLEEFNNHSVLPDI